MTIYNPKPIIEKLEKAGVEAVKKKRAKGLYQVHKLPIIDKWLADKAREIAAADKVKAEIKEKTKAQAKKEATPPPKVTPPKAKKPPKTKAKKPAKAKAKMKPAIKSQARRRGMIKPKR